MSHDQRSLNLPMLLDWEMVGGRDYCALVWYLATSTGEWSCETDISLWPWNTIAQVLFRPTWMVLRCFLRMLGHSSWHNPHPSRHCIDIFCVYVRRCIFLYMIVRLHSKGCRNWENNAFMNANRTVWWWLCGSQPCRPRGDNAQDI